MDETTLEGRTAFATSVPAYALKATDRLGYDYDPFRGLDQTQENTPVWWPSWFPLPFHTWRKWHIGELAAVEGIRLSMWSNFVPCPPLLADNEHYWDTVEAISYELKSKGGSAIVTILAGIAYLKTSGII